MFGEVVIAVALEPFSLVTCKLCLKGLSFDLPTERGAVFPFVSRLPQGSRSGAEQKVVLEKRGAGECECQCSSNFVMEAQGLRGGRPCAGLNAALTSSWRRRVSEAEDPAQV